MRKSDADMAWLEPELRRGLRRVQAPQELWERVALPRVERAAAQPRMRTLAWTLAATSVAAASVMAVAWGHYPSARVDFRSDETSAVQEWIRDRTGIEVPFSVHPDPRIDNIRVSLRQGGIINVRYEVSGRDVSLTVGPVTAAGSHRSIANIHSADSVTWTSGEYTLTLAVHHPADIRAACLICHAGSTI